MLLQVTAGTIIYLSVGKCLHCSEVYASRRIRDAFCHFMARMYRVIGSSPLIQTPVVKVEERINLQRCRPSV